MRAGRCLREGIAAQMVMENSRHIGSTRSSAFSSRPGVPLTGACCVSLWQAASDKAALQEQLRALKATQQAHEQAARSAQAEGDAQYWPIYNLDLKNPHAKAGLEHADPQDLIAAMRSHEAEVMRLLGEIEALVAEVQA